MREFKVGQFTKELVAARAGGALDPCAAAADLIRQTMRVALKNFAVDDPAAEKVFEDAVRGGMQALLLARHDVAVGGTLTLEALAELAVEMGWDPTLVMRGALKGLAGLRRLLTSQQLEGLRVNIEGRFPRYGAAFAELVALQPDPGARHPANG